MSGGYITPALFKTSSDGDNDALMLTRFFDYAINTGGEAVIPFVGWAGYNLLTTVPIASPNLWRSKIRCDGAIFRTSGAIFAFTVTGGGGIGGIALEDFTIHQDGNTSALGGFALLGTGCCKLIRPVVLGGGTSGSYHAIHLGLSNPADPGTGSIWTNIIDPQIGSLSGFPAFGVFMEGSCNETTISGGLIGCDKCVAIYPGPAPYYSASNVKIDGVSFESCLCGVYHSGIAGNTNAAVLDLHVENCRFESISNAGIAIINGEAGTHSMLHEHGNYIANTPTFLSNPQNCPINSTSLPRLLSGQVTFAASTSAAVSFITTQPGSAYVVTLEAPDNKTYWVDTKTQSGFTIHASSATSATVGWKVTRLY